MEVFLIIFVVAIVLGVIWASRDHIGAGNDDVRVQSALEKYGVTPTRVSLQPRSMLELDDQTRRYRFHGVDKAGVEVAGDVLLRALGPPSVMFDRSGAGSLSSPQDEPEDESTLDAEEQVRREVARRLDALQANREEFMANDADGDGMVDSEEWAAARERIEAEVRAEFEANAQPAGAASTQPAEPVTQEEPQAAPTSDGHW